MPNFRLIGVYIVIQNYI